MRHGVSSGFTILELVVVILILSVLASTGISQFSQGIQRFEQRGFRDELLSSIRYAHKMARSSGCWMRVQVASHQVEFKYSLSCDNTSTSLTTLLKNPQYSSGMRLQAPSGMTLGSADIYFNGGGRPHQTSGESALSTSLAVAVGSDILVIEAITGYVHFQ